MNNLIQISKDKQAVTTSIRVAEVFGKRHDNVMKSVNRLIGELRAQEDFTHLKNEVSKYMVGEYTDSTGRKLKQYIMNRDGFTLLAMGFTGKKALEFKIKYINAFNEMEAKLRAMYPCGASAAGKPAAGGEVAVREHTRSLTHDEIKKMLTMHFRFVYTEDLKTIDGNVAPVSIGEFFVPKFWGTRTVNISNSGQRSMALSESPACSYSGGYLKTIEAKMKELIAYTFKSHQIRTTLKDNMPWFVAADVAKALEYQDSTHAIRYLDEDEFSTLPIKEGNRELNIINESGLYSLILRSRKPEAKAFKKFVTAEVLPSIRKTGAYVSDKSVVVAEHTRSLPVCRKKEIVLSEKAKTEIGGIVKAVVCAELAKVNKDSFLDLDTPVKPEYDIIKKEAEHDKAGRESWEVSDADLLRHLHNWYATKHKQATLSAQKVICENSRLSEENHELQRRLNLISQVLG